MNIKTPLSFVFPLIAALGLVISGINEAHAITTIASGAEGYSRPKINNADEIVWSQSSEGVRTVWSNERGQISFGILENDPDINDEGEIIWRFGDGGQGPDGIESNIRGLIYYEQGGDLDPYYDTHRINNTGEIIWSRPPGPTDYRAEEIWSNYRGRLTYSPEYAINRQTAINDNGEVVYTSFLGPTGNTYDILSTEQGEITNDSMWEWYPAINNSQEVVWSQLHSEGWEIWSSEQGRITVNDKEDRFPSINDVDEIVWQYWDGNDFEIMSNIRGQITDNNVDDTRPDINNVGTIVWLSNDRKAISALYSVPEIAVVIDIKPGSNTNPVNIFSEGNFTVAILTTDVFDASMVDVNTVRFGPGLAAPSKYRLDDVDDDGDWDMKLKFKTQETGIACGDTEVTLTGETFDDRSFAGMDSIRTVDCELTFTPVEWTIARDTFGVGIHTIFMIADVSPLVVDDVQDIGGELIWEETQITLCADPTYPPVLFGKFISIRDVGDGFLRIGDGFQTNGQGPGCDINTTMQNAFDDFGLPKNACLSVRSGNVNHEFCAPLNVIQ